MFEMRNILFYQKKSVFDKLSARPNITAVFVKACKQMAHFANIKDIDKMTRPCRWQQQIHLPPKGRLNGIINIGIS